MSTQTPSYSVARCFGDVAAMFRYHWLACLIVLTFSPSASQAEVHFGKNVRIGGHDVSHQTFNRQHRGLYYIHEGKPAHEGCALRSNADGSHTKVCHYQRVK
jgi:hypothetical protein